MPAPRQTGLNKRQKERIRQEKQQRKAEKKAERKASAEKVAHVPGEDPDLAGIVPGPQPNPWDDDGATSEPDDER